MFCSKLASTVQHSTAHYELDSAPGVKTCQDAAVAWFLAAFRATLQQQSVSQQTDPDKQLARSCLPHTATRKSTVETRSSSSSATGGLAYAFYNTICKDHSRNPTQSGKKRAYCCTTVVICCGAAGAFTTTTFDCRKMTYKCAIHAHATRHPSPFLFVHACSYYVQYGASTSS